MNIQSLPVYWAYSKPAAARSASTHTLTFPIITRGFCLEVIVRLR